MSDPVYLVGPTAVGKTEVALLLAEELNAEIVSADSMQVYRGMDIGTAKPAKEEQRRVRHHLIDVVDVREAFNAARFREMALAAVADIQRRGKLPLVVGGSGMYLKALTEGLFPCPKASATRRAELEKVETGGLFEMLRKADPKTAAQIDAHNRRRLIRALEVLDMTGEPIVTQQKQWNHGSAAPMVYLERERSELYGRIEARVDWMFANGLLEETRRLLERGLADNPTASGAAGYREVIAHLQGRYSLDEAKQKTKLRTRHLAKRQLTWFRHQASLRVVRVADTVEQTKEQVLSVLAHVRN